jgi:hypothetical protein
VENKSSAVIWGKDGKKQLIMGVSIYHGWYDRAQVGMRHRMGGKVVQDYGLSKQVEVALEVGLEKEWEAAQDNAGIQLETVQLVCFALFGYGRALWGEEITNIELSGVRKYFGDGATEPRHVELSLTGRFKQVEGEQQHFLPVAAVPGSGLLIREWVERLLKEKEMTGVISGFMFLRTDGKTAWAADFEESLIERLEWIQQNTTGIIPITIDLWSQFGVGRSIWRGVATEALKVGIFWPTIDANNGWRKVESAKGKMPQFSMRRRYTQIFQYLKHQLKFSLGIWGGNEGFLELQYFGTDMFLVLLSWELKIREQVRNVSDGSDKFLRV